MTEFDEGDVVEYIDGDDVTKGVVSGVFESNFKWPTEDGEDTEVEASPDEPVYIVALASGGSKPAEGEEMRESSFEDDGEVPMDSLVEHAKNVELAESYWKASEPEDLSEFRQTLDDHIRYTHREELVNTRGTSDLYAEELLDLPVVDDPGIGFDKGEPEGWDRASYLQAWASLGGTWRSCFGRMSTEMTPRKARRWCSAMKDEIYGTTAWRRFE